jgi:two-component sensor histidine kinase
MWPVMANGRVAGIAIQVVETASPHERTLAMNEALMLGSLRLHEVTADVTALNIRLHAEVAEREQRERDALMLTNELAHRIKNNLQIIVGLIAYEARWTAAPCVQGYQAMQARIGAIAQLYDLISQSSHGQTVGVDAYLREIAKAMSASLIGDRSGIDIEVKAEPLEIDSDRAVPFGLLVNELATNAIKHAFPHGTGHVVLSVEKVGDQIELIVADDGVGLKDGGALKGPEKRGSEYVAVFVRQLGGTIVPSGSEETGTIVRIRIPLLVVLPGDAARAAA